MGYESNSLQLATKGANGVPICSVLENVDRRNAVPSALKKLPDQTFYLPEWSDFGTAKHFSFHICVHAFGHGNSAPQECLSWPEVFEFRSKFFKVVEPDITFYMGEEGEESEAGSLYKGSVLFVAVEGDESRTLHGRKLPVFLFTVGADGKGWYWLPRKRFYGCTEGFDPKKETSTPFLSHN
jgi:hypothetical protein